MSSPGRPGAPARPEGAPPRRRRRGRAAALTALVAGALASAPAEAAPSDEELLWLGAGLALPTYAIGVTLHEGSHALAAKLVGAEVVSLRLLPGRDPSTGAFHFGLTRVRGLRCDAQRVWFLTAPKLVDLTLLGGFTGLVLSDAWPRNRYGQLALTVMATGLWIDFSKDVLSFSPHNDVVKVMTLGGLTDEWRRLPWRLGYATVAVTLAFVVARGYERTFDAAPATPAARAVALPVLHGRF
ncbi:MAG: hypothetical protein R3B48_09215 [Kofleriaceae bacterium]